jgi:hypothetical protein
MSSVSSDIPGTPEDRTEQYSNLCSLGPRPLFMTGILRTLLTTHFSDASNLEDQSLIGKLWSADACSNILIEDATVFTPGNTQTRPAVIIKRNTWKSRKLGINNLNCTTPDGFNQYTKLMVGSHTLFCMAQNGAEAEILCAEVYRYYQHFGPIFREEFGLHMFEVMEAGGLNEIEEASEVYAAPVTIGYAWEDSWILKQHTPKLKTVEFSALFPPECYTVE